jgi:hypothetical protein
VLAALLHFLHVLAEAAAITVTPRPGIAKGMIWGSFLQLVGTVIVLIGTCIFEVRVVAACARGGGRGPRSLAVTCC